MACFKFTYSRSDIKDPCTALKFAHDQGAALKLLCTGSEKKNTLRLARQGIPIKLIEVKEL